MYVRTYVHTHARTYVHVYVRMYVCMYVCMYEEEEEEICLFNIVCSYIYRNKIMFVRKFILSMFMLPVSRIDACMHECMHAYIRKWTHACMYVYRYIDT